MDRGAWWAAVYGGAQSRIQPKGLSSSSSILALTFKHSLIHFFLLWKRVYLYQLASITSYFIRILCFDYKEEIHSDNLVMSCISHLEINIFA